MKYISINNWNDFQHYREGSRAITWIKLYLRITDGYRFYKLSDIDKWLFINLCIIAARKGNKMSMDIQWLNKLLTITNHRFLQRRINNLAKLELITIKDDSKLIAKRYQKDSNSGNLYKTRKEIDKIRKECFLKS